MLAIVAVVLQCLGRIFLALFILSLISGSLGIQVGSLAFNSIAMAACIYIASFTIKTKLPTYRHLNHQQAKRLFVICSISAAGWFFFFSKASGWF